MSKIDKKDIRLELLRVVAILGVICVHVTTVGLNKSNIGSQSWNVFNFFNSITRWCVPIFFMISGAVFLGIKNEISTKNMYTEYVLHLFVVLIFWSVFYSIFDAFVLNKTITLKNIIVSLISWVSGSSGYHLWFLYEMIMIYITLPVTYVFVRSLSKEKFQLIIFLFVVFCCVVNQWNMFLSILPSQFSVLNINFTFPLFTCYLGYFLLGCYLYKYDLSIKLKKILYFFSLLFIILIPIGNLYTSKFLESYSNIFSTDKGFFTLILAIALFEFVLEKGNLITNSVVRKNILKFGEATMGIYLIHVLINSVIFHVFSIDIEFIYPIFSVLIFIFVIFYVSYLLVVVLKRVKIIKRLL